MYHTTILPFYSPFQGNGIAQCEPPNKCEVILPRNEMKGKCHFYRNPSVYITYNLNLFFFTLDLCHKFTVIVSSLYLFTPLFYSLPLSLFVCTSPISQPTSLLYQSGLIFFPSVLFSCT